MGESIEALSGDEILIELVGEKLVTAIIGIRKVSSCKYFASSINKLFKLNVSQFNVVRDKLTQNLVGIEQCNAFLICMYINVRHLYKKLVILLQLNPK